MLEDFHNEAVDSPCQRGTNLANISLLNQGLRNHKSQIWSIPEVVKAVVQKLQREANRGFTPVIQAEMEPAYEWCSNERGE
jgi:hypothetical protein